MRRILKNKDVEKFSEDMYIVSCVNCAIWVLYGIVTPGRLAPLVTNAVGLAMNLVYVLIFAVSNPPNYRRFVLKVLSIPAIITMLVLVVYLIIPATKDDETKTQEKLLGITADVFNLLMYSGPLTIISVVRKSKSVFYMPLPLTIGSTLCSCSWLLYGLKVMDWWIIIPNGGGCFLSAVQIVVYMSFMNTNETVRDRKRGVGSIGSESRNETEKIGLLEEGQSKSSF